MLSLDLAIMASNVDAAHTALPIFTCNDHVLELVMNKNFDEDWQCFVDSQAFYLVLDGSLTFHYAEQESFEVKKGEYVLVDKNHPYRILDSEGCNYLFVHKKSFNREQRCAESLESAFVHGNFVEDMKFKPIEINNHIIQLINTNELVTEEAFMDTDRAVFVMDGEMILADVYGEEVLGAYEIANIPAHAFHRLFCKSKTRGFTFQKKDSKIMYIKNS